MIQDLFIFLIIFHTDRIHDRFYLIVDMLAHHIRRLFLLLLLYPADDLLMLGEKLRVRLGPLQIFNSVAVHLLP